MDDDYRELANRLFARATVMLEDAIETAVKGQSSRLKPSQLSDVAHQLQTAVREIAVIAQAAAIVADLGAKSLRNRRKSRR